MQLVKQNLLLWQQFCSLHIACNSWKSQLQPLTEKVGDSQRLIMSKNSKVNKPLGEAPKGGILYVPPLLVTYMPTFLLLWLLTILHFTFFFFFFYSDAFIFYHILRLNSLVIFGLSTFSTILDLTSNDCKMVPTPTKCQEWKVGQVTGFSLQMIKILMIYALVALVNGVVLTFDVNTIKTGQQKNENKSTHTLIN